MLCLSPLLLLYTVPPLSRSSLFPYTTLFRSRPPKGQRGSATVVGPPSEGAHCTAGTHPVIRHAFLRRKIPEDRKSTRLNSSHLVNSYAVFCMKKKKSHADFYSERKQDEARE